MPDIDAIVQNHTTEPSAEAPAPAPEPQASEPQPQAAEQPSEAPQSPAEPAEQPQSSPSSSSPPEERMARLERLMEAERDYRSRQEQLQQQEQELQQRAQQLEGLQQYQNLAQTARSRNLGQVLEQLGIDPQEAQQALAEGRAVDPLAPVREQFDSRLSQTEQKLEAELKELREYQYQEAVRRARSETTRQIQEHSSLLAASGDIGVEAVLSSYKQHYNETGQAPSYQEVIQKAEQDLVEFLKPFVTNDELLRRLRPEASSETQSSVKPQTTLSNRDAATVTNRKPEEDLSGLKGEQLIEALVRRHSG